MHLCFWANPILIETALFHVLAEKKKNIAEMI